ncbi:DUF3127 domain-containing protein [Sphingobacterium corticibacter]|uniref:DUF3127 domain-containing protein n=1 Tax=Sphingobacterium corticibacter TaxID=2171749 RepID=A0A2T8HLL1_9SPHI|nr:DUF3127 domain-containing protein [Sphingobacterium corticibacter]PVH26260.1 hypothetical protein DC487_01145 [Sphingobacterium corticibacter]
MEIRGKVHEIGTTIQVTESFKKRDLLVAYAENPQFVEYLTFQAMQDRVSLFDNLTIGQDIEVSFNIKGRPWTNKDGMTTYFNTLVAWRITPLQVQQLSKHSSAGAVEMPPPMENLDYDDDLPF